MSDPATAHIPSTPAYAFIVRIFQFILALIVLGLVGHSIDGCTDEWNLSEDCGLFGSKLEPANFVVFCSVWTWIIVGYLIVTPLWLPVAYNMWAQLFFEVTGCIFWLCGFAALAAKVAWLKNRVDDAGYGNYEMPAKWKTAAAGAGLGALLWILFIVTMVSFILALRSHLNDPANQGLSRLGLSGAEKGTNNEMGPVVQQPTPYPAQATPAPQGEYPQPVQSPVSYVQPTPPPQQWQQSPPAGQYQ